MTIDYWSEMTFSSLGGRSNIFVLGITVFFAVAGALFILFYDLGLWALWVPLCFLIIPPIQYLCREVLRLRRKIEELEKRLD